MFAGLRDAINNAAQSADGSLFTNRAADAFALPDSPLAPPTFHDVFRSFPAT